MSNAGPAPTDSLTQIQSEPANPPVRNWKLPPRPQARSFGYEALECVGGGTFAEVWKVREPESGKCFALKQIRPEWESREVARRILENEAEVGQRVHSQHIVRVLEAKLDGTPRFVVLEWLEGTTLAAMLSNQPISCTAALWRVRQCLQGLIDLEAAGFLHGDIKPANIFVQHDGTIKLIDLGFARRISSPSTGELAGTPEFLAPELVAGCAAAADPAGTSRDLYGMGIVLYRLLTGRLPFQGDTLAEVLHQQQHDHAPPIRRLAPHVPREVADFAERLLSKQPFRRGAGPRSLMQEIIALELAALTADVRVESSHENMATEE